MNTTNPRTATAISDFNILYMHPYLCQRIVTQMPFIIIHLYQCKTGLITIGVQVTGNKITSVNTPNNDVSSVDVRIVKMSWSNFLFCDPKNIFFKLVLRTFFIVVQNLEFYNKINKIILSYSNFFCCYKFGNN